jgi:hypothetical protein
MHVIAIVALLMGMGCVVSASISARAKRLVPIRVKRPRG